MTWIADGLTALVALLHFYFMYLEMFLWATPKGRKVFGTSEQAARDSKVLAANQGLYNGLLGCGLLVSFALASPQAAAGIRVFCLAFIVVAGIYGAATVNKRIFFLQTLPAALALGLFSVSFFRS